MHSVRNTARRPLRRSDLITLEEYEAMFHRFRRSAFRLEARDTYDVAFEREELKAFQDGEALPEQSPETDSWLAVVASAAASGRTVERVRLVGQPLNVYTRFEFAAYPANIAAGETIRVLERRSLPEPARRWVDKDFWIFDDETVVLLHYNHNGQFLGIERPNDIDIWLAAKRHALALAVDFTDFLAGLERQSPDRVQQRQGAPEGSPVRTSAISQANRHGLGSEEQDCSAGRPKK